MSIIGEFNEKEGRMLQHGFILFVGFLNILIVIIGVFFIVNMGKMKKGDETQRPQLSVSGEGKMFVRPDIAIVAVSALTSAEKVGEAQNKNSVRINEVMNFLKQNKIEEKDIKTINYSIQPQYQYDNGRPCPLSSPCPVPVNSPPRIVSYEVRHALEIRVRDLNMVDDILQGVISAGGNEIGSVTFAVDDEKAVMAQARKQAIEDARRKAVVLARDLGVRLVKISAFSESGGGPVYPRFLGFESMKAADSSAVQVAPGEQEIRSNVTITYDFR